MRRKTRFVSILVLFLSFCLLPLSAARAQKAEQLIGRDTLNFTLPSTKDSLINYAEEYYGKHHLIVTFFPAAFTPI